MITTTADCAQLLLTVASHLANHPALFPVDVIAPNRLQVLCPTRAERAAALVEWGRTLDGEVRVEVRNAFDAAHVHLHGEIDGLDVLVFTTVSGLAYVMGEDAFHRTDWELGGVAWITLDALEDFVDTGQRPEALVTPAPA